MKRATRPALKRDAAAVSGNASPGSGQAARAEDVAVLTRALDDEPLVREHAAWAHQQIGDTTTAADPEALGAEATARHRA